MKEGKVRVSDVYSYELVKFKSALTAYGRPDKFRLKVSDVVKQKRQAEVDEKIAAAMSAADAARAEAVSTATAADVARGGLFGFF